MNIYYVYVLFDWCGVPRYVGKGKGNRWFAHERATDSANFLKNEFIEQTWAVLGEIPKIKVRENISSVEANEIEITLIGAIGRVINRTGPLTNITEGGDGVRGERSQAFRDKQRRILLMNTTPEQRRAQAKKGALASLANRTPEILAAISAKTTANWQDPEHRAKHRAARTTPEARARARKALDSTNTIWITDGIKQTRIPKNETIPDGWRLGRNGQRWSNGGGARETTWITNGNETIRLKKDQSLPEGWQYGRGPDGITIARKAHSLALLFTPEANKKRSASLITSWEERRRKYGPNGFPPRKIRELKN